MLRHRARLAQGCGAAGDEEHRFAWRRVYAPNGVAALVYDRRWLKSVSDGIAYPASRAGAQANCCRAAAEMQGATRYDALVKAPGNKNFWQSRRKRTWIPYSLGPLEAPDDTLAIAADFPAARSQQPAKHKVDFRTMTQTNKDPLPAAVRSARTAMRKPVPSRPVSVSGPQVRLFQRPRHRQRRSARAAGDSPAEQHEPGAEEELAAPSPPRRPCGV